MQIVACVASSFNTIISLTNWDFYSTPCWYFYSENFTDVFGPICHQIEVSPVSHQRPSSFSFCSSA